MVGRAGGRKERARVTCRKYCVTFEDWLLPILHQIKPQRLLETPGADTRADASVSCDLGLEFMYSPVASYRAATPNRALSLLCRGLPKYHMRRPFASYRALALRSPSEPHAERSGCRRFPLRSLHCQLFVGNSIPSRPSVIVSIWFGTLTALSWYVPCSTRSSGSVIAPIEHAHRALECGYYC